MEPPCGVWSASPWPPGRDLVFLTRPVAILGIGGLPRNPLHSTSERLWWARMCLLFAEHHAAAFSPWVGVIVRFMMVKLIPSDAFLKWDMVSGLGTLFEFVGRRVFPGDDMIFIACLFSQHHYVRWDLFGCKFDEPFVWWEIYFIWKRLPNLQKKIAVEPFHKPFKFIPRNTKSNQIMKGHFTPKVTSNHTNMPAHTHSQSSSIPHLPFNYDILLMACHFGDCHQRSSLEVRSSRNGICRHRLWISARLNFMLGNFSLYFSTSSSSIEWWMNRAHKHTHTNFQFGKAS